MLRKLATFTVIFGLITITHAAAQTRSYPAYPAYPAPVVAPVPFIWTGFYGGVFGGFGSGELGTKVCCATPFSAEPAPAGGFGGTTFGYNWQFDPSWVVGVEADFAYGRIQDSVDLAFREPFFATSLRSRLDYFGTVRGRIGWTSGNLLIYGTGGFAWGHNELTLDVPLLGGTSSLFDEHTHTGWTAGGGFEWAVNRNWSIKAEYLYVDLSGERYNFLCGVLPNVDADLKIHTAKLGVNYRFDLNRLFGPLIP